MHQLVIEFFTKLINWSELCSMYHNSKRWLEMSRRVCVPMNSPAWKHYLEEGWIFLRKEGAWVILVSQPDIKDTTGKADELKLRSE